MPLEHLCICPPGSARCLNAGHFAGTHADAKLTTESEHSIRGPQFKRVGCSDSRLMYFQRQRNRKIQLTIYILSLLALKMIRENLPEIS